MFLTNNVVIWNHSMSLSVIFLYLQVWSKMVSCWTFNVRSYQLLTLDCGALDR